jgi:hypothetical protein
VDALGRKPPVPSPRAEACRSAQPNSLRTPLQSLAAGDDLQSRGAPAPDGDATAVGTGALDTVSVEGAGERGPVRVETCSHSADQAKPRQDWTRNEIVVTECCETARSAIADVVVQDAGSRRLRAAEHGATSGCCQSLPVQRGHKLSASDVACARGKGGLIFLLTLSPRQWPAIAVGP